MVLKSIYPNGTKYEETEYGVKQGNGKITFYSKDVYEGQFDNDNINGYGKITYNNNDIYLGDWENNKKHGFGCYRSYEGDFYQGEWRNDKRHGVGEIFYKNYKITFRGKWKDDKKIGDGFYTFSDSETIYKSFHSPLFEDNIFN